MTEWFISLVTKLFIRFRPRPEVSPDDSTTVDDISSQRTNALWRNSKLKARHIKIGK